ncbi:MAG: TIM barrel protein [Chloroflexota bacterium]
MRLGGYYTANTIEQLESLCPQLDAYGLSAIPAPPRLIEMSDDECVAFGEAARTYGIVIGEIGMWQNLMTEDDELRQQRIENVRTLLCKADLAGCHCVVTLIGTKHPSDVSIAPHAYMYTDECRAEFREIVLRILDGLDLQTTRYVIEPWHNSFFYQPEVIRAFIDSVDHPALGVHLDQMNMVTQESYFNTTDLINRTFDLLADVVASVHLKDINCDYRHMFLKLDEVLIGDGVMDYETYLRRISQLPDDTPCFCEHLPGEADYLVNFGRLHELAAKVDVQFLRRGA